MKKINTSIKNNFLNTISRNNNLNINNRKRKLFNISFKNIYAVYKLTGVMFVRNHAAIFFTFFYPFLILIIMGSIIKLTTNSNSQVAAFSGNLIISGISIAGITSNGLNSLSLRLTQWRSSTIIKRIGSMPLSKFEFLFGVLLWYAFIIIIQLLWLLAMAFILFSVKSHPIGNFSPNHIKVEFILLGWFLAMFFSLVIGVFLASLTNDPNTNSFFGLMIYLPSAFLSGQYINLTVIDKSKGLEYVSIIWPQRYMVTFVSQGFYYQKQNPFSSSYDPAYWNHFVQIGGFFYPFLICILLLILSTKIFKWE